MKITADYVRVSFDKTGAAAGVGSQHDENEELADDHGLTIERTYTDNDTSAFSGVERPGYAALIADIVSGVVGVVIIWHANRLHRSVTEAEAFVKIARAHGVKLYSVAKAGLYPLHKASGRAELLSDTVKAQEESEHKGERVALARKRQARNGEYGGGTRAFGWGVDTGRVRSVCVNPKADVNERVYENRPVLDMRQHNPAEAEEIRSWARDLLAGVSMRQVLAGLRERGVTTITGGSWDSKTVFQILTAPRVAGHSEYRGEVVKRNAFPEIIPEDQRQAIITLFADPTRKTSPGNTPKWLGSLIYRCGVCDDDSTMTVRKNSRGQFVYRCRTKGHCSRQAVPVDGFVERVMVARLSRGDVAGLLPQRATADVGALRDRLRELDAEETDVAIRAAQKKITAVMMEVFSAEIERQRAEIRKLINDATADSPLAEFAVTDDAARTWDGLTLGRKREILRLLTPITLFPSMAKTLDPATIRFDAWI